MSLSLALLSLVAQDATYLASMTVPLGPDERLRGFAFETWGVQFKAVCRIPSGWRIKAGASATPDGTLEGTASHGATFLGRARLGELDALVLVTLSGPMREAARVANGEVPATFAGQAIIDDDSEDGRRVPIGVANIGLRPAARCP